MMLIHIVIHVEPRSYTTTIIPTGVRLPLDVSTTLELQEANRAGETDASFISDGEGAYLTPTCPLSINAHANSNIVTRSGITKTAMPTKNASTNSAGKLTDDIHEAIMQGLVTTVIQTAIIGASLDGGGNGEVKRHVERAEVVRDGRNAAALDVRRGLRGDSLTEESSAAARGGGKHVPVEGGVFVVVVLCFNCGLLGVSS